MTATKSTVLGRYQAYTSDSTTSATIYVDLATALNAEGINPEKVIVFDITSKIVIYGR